MSLSAETMERRLPEIQVLGSRVHPVQLGDALASMERWITSRERGRCVIVTGMHGVIEGYRNLGFRAILNAADLFVPDGYSLVWLARRRGVALKRRVCGSDLLWEFCRLASQKGYRIFLYGDTEGVLQRLVARCRVAFPGLQIAGWYSPPFRPLTASEDAQIVQRINAAAPDVLWVGLGLPKQERWIAEHRDRLDVPVCVAVGAAFKLLSGDVTRAPRWMGNHGLEWVWRFLHEPRRLWRRALIDVPQFAGLSLLELVGWIRVEARRPKAALADHDRQRVSAAGNAMKRAFDIVLASAGLLGSLPLWLMFACLIKWEDGGPVFYVQERVGQGGRWFRSLKFRTMIPDADQRYGPLQATEHDPRVTRIGRMLRATALDELPQLWNILKGDMSFVGPRALAPGEIETGSHGIFVSLQAIPGYERRHRIRPGLTGIAQIYAPRDVPRKQKFRYDLFYISKRYLWLDLKLIALSCWITMRGTWEHRARKF